MDCNDEMHFVPDYWEEVPSEQNGKNLLAAASRGGGLREITEGIDNAIVMPGRKLGEITKTILKSSSPQDHVYMMCGIPDITRLIKDESNNYKDGVFNDSVSYAVSRVTDEIRLCENSIKDVGAVRIFAP